MSSSKTAKAFAPGNISLIFAVKKGKTPDKTGSTGVGFTINKGVTVLVKKANGEKNQAYFNGKKVRLPTVDAVVRKLTKEKLRVEISTELHFGGGFGISGASALATAYAANELLCLKKTKKELALIAHAAEVENMTGLGDVVNQYHGGFLIKNKPSYTFKVKRLPINNKQVHYRYFSILDTKKILSDKGSKEKLEKAGRKAMRQLEKLSKNKCTLSNLLNISDEFSTSSGLLRNRKVKSTINKIKQKKGNATMIMLGNSVLSDKPFKQCKKLIIKKKPAKVLK